MYRITLVFLLFSSGAWPSDKVLTQDETIAQIRNLGGAVGLDETKPGKPGVFVFLTGSNVADKEMPLLRGFSSIEIVGLDDCEITDAGLKCLQNLKCLNTLSLNGTNISDAGLRHLKGHTQLRFLSLKKTKVTAKGIKTLKIDLPKVEVLWDRPPFVLPRIEGRRSKWKSF